MNTKFRFAAVLLCALAGSLAHQAAHAYALFFETSANPVNVGDTFTVKVQLDDPASLASVDLFMSFDEALLEMTGATSPGFAQLADSSFTPTIDNGSGLALFSMESATGFASTATGPLTLLEVSFLALGEGSATISLPKSNDLGFNLAPPLQTAIADGSDARVDVRIRAGTVKVPEPASLALLGVAIAAAGVGAARRRAAA